MQNRLQRRIIISLALERIDSIDGKFHCDVSRGTVLFIQEATKRQNTDFVYKLRMSENILEHEKVVERLRNP